jgi:hypothetical protein
MPDRFYRRLPKAAWLVAFASILVLIAAIGWALARGLTINCGCFGAAPASRGAMWTDLGRDLALGAAALWLYVSALNAEDPHRAERRAQ